MSYDTSDDLFSELQRERARSVQERVRGERLAAAVERFFAVPGPVLTMRLDSLAAALRDYRAAS